VLSIDQEADADEIVGILSFASNGVILMAYPAANFLAFQVYFG
jgi:hypothetical protein